MMQDQQLDDILIENSGSNIHPAAAQQHLPRSNTAQLVHLRFTTGQTLTLPLPPGSELAHVTIGQLRDLIKSYVLVRYRECKRQQQAFAASAAGVAAGVAAAAAAANSNSSSATTGGTERENLRALKRLLIKQNKHMRFIYQGKMLQDHLSLQFYGFENGNFLHVTLSEPQQQASASQTAPQLQESPLDSTALPTSDGPQGFDRLREAGFEQAEVMYIRNTFYANRQHLLAQLQQGLITEQELRRMEEQWMDEEHHFDVDVAQGASAAENAAASAADEDDNITSTARLNFEYDSETGALRDIRGSSEEPIFDDDDGGGAAAVGARGPMASTRLGSNYDFFYGITLGFLIGFLVLVSLFEKSVSTKFKYGALIGVIANLGIGLVLIFSPSPFPI